MSFDMFNLVIAGSRSCYDYDLIEEEVDDFIYSINPQERIQIYSGGARGADKLGELYASNRGYAVKIFNADWDNFGRAAGPIRNREMLKTADAVIVFWDGMSRGTSDCISRARELNLPLKIVKIC